MTQSFEDQISLKYNVFNSIFLTLKFDEIRRTGILLPIFNDYCKTGFEKGKNPREIINAFFDGQNEVIAKKDRYDVLFRFVQYIERQVVLVDALEDAAFHEMNDVDGIDSLKQFIEAQLKTVPKDKLLDALRSFKIRVVLTAHPTQFYPGSVLGIITDLENAIRANNLLELKALLEQLGITPFFKRSKPTPFDEAVSLNWFLENVFYQAIPQILQNLKSVLDGELNEVLENFDMIQLGFWPGGDRDGNPYVNRETTLKVATKLHQTLLKCYYRDVRKLKRRLTFSKVDEMIHALDNHISDVLFSSGGKSIELNEIMDPLNRIKEMLEKDYNSLFVELVDDLILKLQIFGFHFASLDIRQDSRIIETVFQKACDQAGWQPKTFDDYFESAPVLNDFQVENELEEDTFNLFKTIDQIQSSFGESACHRFIMSNCSEAKTIAQVYAMAKMNGWKTPVSIDIAPLFETIDALANAPETMRKLYECKPYADHLRERKNRQVVMLGFSDGTKDGGYFAANWSIYQAKEAITKVSREYGIKVVFFDGRGGPPARGGGNVNQYYASQDNRIENKEIQLTIQGQTVSSKFGNVDKARFYLERLITAGLSNNIETDELAVSNEERVLFEKIAALSLKAYRELRENPLFISYLEERTPLTHFGATNIASRPSKRGRTEKLTLNDLRAIPFVGSWNQVKQNVPGYYGFGNAIEQVIKEEGVERLQEMYASSSLFRSLISNSMQSLSKCYFPLTAYQADDPKFGNLWNTIFKEYERTVKTLLSVTELPAIMDNQPTLKQSIELREQTVLPLLTIQQYAMMKTREVEGEEAQTLSKLIIRCMYGIINAARNSA